MKDNLHTLVYAAVLGIVCAALLTGAGWATNERRENNELAEEVRNILDVLNVPVDANASAKELVAKFKEKVKEEKVGENRVFLYEESDSSGAARAIEFSGQGLWGPIKGFLALEPDRRTIRGITFYQQQETPGLGAEIASEWFTNQFKGKSIEPPVTIVSPSANKIDAISGATMTCKKVEQMLKETMERIVKERR